MSEDQDAALVLACRNGNRHAFDQLLARYERPVFNAAFRILNHREDATDVTQAVFLRVYEHLDQFNPAQRLFSWIYRIAINEALDVASARKRSEPLPEDLETGRSGPEELAADRQLDAGMQAALMALNIEYRTVIVLKHLQGCSYEDIAAILDCPVKTVKSRLFTARHALRDVLIARHLV
jgi:RNA polymerase sigma-70 factor (ECF subfamily)